MKYNEFKRMMNLLRKEVANFCRGQIPTIDETWSLQTTLGYRCWFLFGKPDWNRNDFLEAVGNTVRNEILRVCT